MLIKRPYILGVLSTSIGKSLSFLLISSLSTSKITLVILPLVGLKLDLLRRTKEFNIPCSIYKELREFRNITLISIESITSTSFNRSVQELIESSRLNEIVLDEFYLLTSSTSYRFIILSFYELLRFRI